MTVQDVVESALRKIQAYASGEQVEEHDMTDGIKALLVMLRHWSSRGLLIFATMTDTLTLVSGQATYTWEHNSFAADIQTPLPNKVLTVVLRDGELLRDINLLNKSRFMKLERGEELAKPIDCTVDFGFPVASITFSPVPDKVYTVKIESSKPYSDVTDEAFGEGYELQLPLIYEEAVIYNLAVRLASEYGKVVPPDVASLANDSYNGLVKTNAIKSVDYADLTHVVPFMAIR